MFWSAPPQKPRECKPDLAICDLCPNGLSYYSPARSRHTNVKEVGSSLGRFAQTCGTRVKTDPADVKPWSLGPVAFPWLNTDRECHKLMAATPRLKGRLDILTSIPGPGKITALVLLVDMPELGSMDAKHAASLAGFAPITRQSGQWRGKAFIQGGRATL